MEINSEEQNIENSERKSPVTEAYPSIKGAFALIGIFVLISLILALPVAVLYSHTEPVYKSMITAISYVVSMLLFLFVGLRLRRSLRFSFKASPFSVFVMVIPLMVCITILLEPLINLIPMPDLFKAYFDEMLSTDMYTFLTVAVAAPILEELVFRGIILDGFLKRYSPLKSILWSSIFFGIAHLNPWQFIEAFSIGLVMGWLYNKTRSLHLCMFMHMVTNAFGFAVIFYTGSGSGSTDELFTNHNFYWVVYGICIAFTIILLVMINHKLQKPKEIATENSED